MIGSIVSHHEILERPLSLAAKGFELQRSLALITALSIIDQRLTQ